MITEPDRAKVERAMLAYRVFNFAVKAVTAGLNTEPTIEQYNRIWQVVQQVAGGESTLNASPAELAMVSPPMTIAMREAYEQNMQKSVQPEKEIAGMLLAACEGFFTPRQP